MRVKDTELQKINNNDIKKYEEILNSIDEQEKGLLDDFDKNIDRILGDHTKDIFEIIKELPNYGKGECIRITVNGIEYLIPKNFLLNFHKSFIKEQELKTFFENKLSEWFSSKTKLIKDSLNNKDSYQELRNVLSPAFALSTLAIRTFHSKPNVVLNDVQKMSAIAMSDGNIVEIGDREEKALEAILPIYLHALSEKGVHVITKNDYLSKRDYDETLPIYTGLGLTSGYLFNDLDRLAEIEGKESNNLYYNEKKELENRIKIIKQKSYKCDVTYGSNASFALDYLKDSSTTKKEDMLQRDSKPAFALIDEVDDILVNNAETPYKIPNKTFAYTPDISLKKLCSEQMILYQDLLPKIKEYGINLDSLTYEEAKFISNEFGKKNILPNIEKYQEAAQKFYSFQKVLTVENDRYGFRTGKELYNAIIDEDKYDADLLRKKYGIIYCNELKDFKVADKCYNDFIKYCYFTIEINALAIKYQEQIKNDRNYIVSRDYKILPNGRITLSMDGANKVLNDSNYPDFIEDYNRYLSSNLKDNALLIHTLNQTITANLIMNKDEDYNVDNGRILIIKNDTAQEGLTYSEGLQQAIEIKENIPKENRTVDNDYLSTITQRDYYNRYNMFSGMTGTSLKELFKEIYNKETVEIPKNSFYKCYGGRKTTNEEPKEILNEKIKFALNKEDKINLVINSIKKSNDQKQPVIVAMASDNDAELLENKLKEENIKYNLLIREMSEEDKALALAKSGRPGMVTILQEVIANDANIKLGGDRDTIIDIATERHLRNIDKKEKTILEHSSFEREATREKLEIALNNSDKIQLWSEDEEKENSESLKDIGIKVIESGIFKTNRIEKQIDGIIDENNIFGICERYACVDDLKTVGLSTFNMKDSVEETLSTFGRNADGSVAIGDMEYESVTSRIVDTQKNNEKIEKEIIKASQKIENSMNQLIEEYRNQRSQIISEKANLNELFDEMIEIATDGIICSYVLKREIKEDDLKRPLNDINLKIDVDAIRLESKQTLGVTFDSRLVASSKMNLIELRDAIIKTAKERHKEFANNDKEAILTKIDYLITLIPDCLEKIYSVKKITPLARASGEKEASSSINFGKAKEKLIIDSCKVGCQKSIGIPLSKSEFKELEIKKAKVFEMIPVRSNILKASQEKKLSEEKNNENLLEKFKKIKEKLQNKGIKQANLKETDVQSNDNNSEQLKAYSNIKVKPLKLMDSIVDGKEVKKVDLVQDYNKLGITNNRTL